MYRNIGGDEFIVNWEAISAVGTCLAAIVGIAGIWLNFFEKTKKVDVSFETVPSFKIYLSNNSLRTTVITKMVYSIKAYTFHVEYFDGLKELTLPPATTKCVDIIKQDIHDAYCKRRLCVKCKPNDKVIIMLYDNYGRKYTIKTDLSIGAFTNEVTL